jgi:hypothetical protein
MNAKAFFLLPILALSAAYAVLSYTNHLAQKRAEIEIQNSIREQQLKHQGQNEERENLSAKLDQLRQIERETKERELQATKSAMEQELALEIQIARKRSLAREEMRRREKAWQDYYKPSESCVGTLSGDVSNRCMQQKIDAKKAFLRQYNQSSERL